MTIKWDWNNNVNITVSN